MRSYLIVDDNTELADNLAEILVETGAHVDVVSSGQDALEKAAHNRYDALVSDMRMPVMHGAELIHRMRRLDPGLPAVVVSAYTRDDDLAAARREGLLAVLPKPAPVARLVELVSGAKRNGLVAVVEDDPGLLENLTEALRAHGFSAVTARSLVETERMEGIAPFLAIADLRVPGGPDGVCVDRLKLKFPQLPVFVITAHADTAPLPAYHRLFTKPFRTAELMAAVENAYGVGRA